MSTLLCSGLRKTTPTQSKYGTTNFHVKLLLLLFGVKYLKLVCFLIQTLTLLRGTWIEGGSKYRPTRSKFFRFICYAKISLFSDLCRESLKIANILYVMNVSKSGVLSEQIAKMVRSNAFSMGFVLALGCVCFQTLSQYFKNYGLWLNATTLGIEVSSAHHFINLLITRLILDINGQRTGACTA